MPPETGVCINARLVEFFRNLLETQPLDMREKQFRFVFYKGGSQWYGEPVSAPPDQYCRPNEMPKQQ